MKKTNDITVNDTITVYDHEKMREIGGYIEFEHYNKTYLHKNALALNCGRNALASIK